MGKPVRSISLDGYGRILAGGDFSSFNEIPTASIVRLSPDGSLEDAFLDIN